jgi:hypothetical protein
MKHKIIHIIDTFEYLLIVGQAGYVEDSHHYFVADGGHKWMSSPGERIKTFGTYYKILAHLPIGIASRLKGVDLLPELPDTKIPLYFNQSELEVLVTTDDGTPIWQGEYLYTEPVIEKKDNIKVGDLVETCSLMPGVVMKLDGSDIQVRMLDVDEYRSDDYAHCSLKHCGIVKLTAKDVLDRLTLGKKRLIEIWDSMNDFDSDNGFMEEYNRRIQKALSNE